MADRTRRDFLAKLGAGAGVLLATPSRLGAWAEAAAAGGKLAELAARAPVARYWIAETTPGVRCDSCHEAGSIDAKAGPRHQGTVVRCLLCAHRCLLAPGERGRCRVRLNLDGTLRSLVYGRPLTVHVDPIEKKPFFHFLPGAQAFSFGTAGCPLRCQFCQNWTLSQANPEDDDVTPVAPAELAALAHERAPVVAFTYNEPTVFTEYLTDVARAARPLGLRPVLVSCGFMNEAPLSEMCDVLDAIKIDLKGFSPEFYRTVSQADLKAVLRSIEQVRKRGRHLELVNLVVPTLNDADAMLDGLARWVVETLGRDVPVHFTRFHPDYQLRHLPPTPVATLERARAIAMARGVRYAYVGNVPGHPGNHTYCPRCGKVVLGRRDFFVTERNLKDGRCASCGEAIAGVWS